MLKEATGAIVILAYPEEFVSMIPAWYRKPMEWVGMVNNGKIAAGHAAMALIEKSSGNIHYADFGRYVTPFGYGRTRMAHTDPDVGFDYKVQFDNEGVIVNREELFRHIYEHPEKTHGGDVMYISLNQNVDFQNCYQFITEMNRKGSIIYDPFGKGNSNCSRFVYDSILKGVRNPQDAKRLKKKSILTPSPLGNVFHGSVEESFRFSPEGKEQVTNTSIMTVIKHLFAKPKDNGAHHDAGQAQKDSWYFLGGIGDQAFFEQVDWNKDRIRFKKYGVSHQLDYTVDYRLAEGFDPSSEYELIHDCNAAWITAIQKNIKYRMNAVEHIYIAK